MIDGDDIVVISETVGEGRRLANMHQKYMEYGIRMDFDIAPGIVRLIVSPDREQDRVEEKEP
jgi:hypothetical protein